MSKPIRVYAFGTFDGLHAGHRSYLAQARTHGDELIVVVARDENVVRIKGARPTLSENDRQQLLEHAGLADQVILGSRHNPLEIFESQEIDVVVLGYDQRVTEQDVSEAAEHYGQHPTVIRAKAFLPLLYKNSVLKPLGVLGRLLGRTG